MTSFILLDAYWRTANYLAVGMIYLQDNALLKEPLRPEHIKPRLLGSLGLQPRAGLHLDPCQPVDKEIRPRHDLHVRSWPRRPRCPRPCVHRRQLQQSAIQTNRLDAEGLQKFFKMFSFPGHIGSHCTAEMPGSIHEGGELGYVLSHACGSVLDNPELITIACVGDGEAETGPLATSWHINKFLNPIRDGAVLPILHLNGYKIANPTILSRIDHEELENLFKGYGWTPIFVEGSDPMTMHREMSVAFEQAVLDIRSQQEQARTSGEAFRPRWPMIVLRSPKGWTGPQEVDGKKIENFWRSHQVPVADVRTNESHLRLLEDWMKSYRPWELFDDKGAVKEHIRNLAPSGNRRMGSNPTHQWRCSTQRPAVPRDRKVCGACGHARYHGRGEHLPPWRSHP